MKGKLAFFPPLKDKSNDNAFFYAACLVILSG